MKQTFDLEQYKTMILGFSQRKVAKFLGVPRTTIQDYLVRNNLDYYGNDVELPVPESKPNILLLDLESAPTLAYVWSRWNNNINSKQVKQEGGFLLSAAWKWYGEDRVHSLAANNPIVGDDYNICHTLHEVVEQADIIISHNGNGYDFKMLNARLVINGLKPIKSVKKVDTLAIARREFRFNSNKLDDLGTFLNVGNKVENGGMELWVRVLQGCSKAMEEMLEYNRGDVTLLENVWLKLRAFDSKPTYNAAHYYNDNLPRCVVCGSSALNPTGNSSFTPVSSFSEIVCDDCGARQRKRNVTNTKEKRQSILVK